MAKIMDLWKSKQERTHFSSPTVPGKARQTLPEKIHYQTKHRPISFLSVFQPSLNRYGSKKAKINPRAISAEGKRKSKANPGHFRGQKGSFFGYFFCPPTKKVTKSDCRGQFEIKIESI